MLSLVLQRRTHAHQQCPEYLVSPAVHVTKIPSQLEPDVAAPLLCGMWPALRFISLILSRWISGYSGYRHVLINHED